MARPDPKVLPATPRARSPRRTVAPLPTLTTTGAQSRAIVEPVAAGVREQILAGAEWLRAPHYAMAVDALAVTEARLRLVDAAIAERGLWNRKGRPWAFVEYGWRLERLADNLRQSLGLTPASRARLGRQVAAAQVDAARVWSGLQAPPQPEPQGATPTAAEPAEPTPEQGEQPEPGGPLRLAGADE